MTKRFWIVRGSSQPEFTHTTLRSAKKEAEHLANKNPGTSFTLLQSVGTVTVHQMQWEFDADEEECPPPV